jgi:hypothetical protein
MKLKMIKMFELSPEVKAAIIDLRYLLNRGYSRETALNFVSNHYRFSLAARHLLARCVFSAEESTFNSAKKFQKSRVKGKKLGVDGYNVLITVESILGGRTVAKCDDGFIRDVSAVFGKYKFSPLTTTAIDLIVDNVLRAKPAEVFFLFDKQVSRSGELAGKIRDKLNALSLRGDARTVPEVDLELRKFEVVASSDRAVIRMAEAVWDIPAEILKLRGTSFLDIKKIR